MLALHIAFFVLAPALASEAARRWRPAHVLGPVVLCYVLGILWGSQPWVPVPPALAEQVAGAGVAMAIALMLLALDVRAWRHLARDTTVGALLAFLSSMLTCAVGGWLFRDHVADTWQVAGMLTGVYVGGTVNMAAIASALEVEPAYFVSVSTAEMAIGGAYYFFLLICGARLFGWFLRPPARAPEPGSASGSAAGHTAGARLRVREVAAALLAGVAIVGAALAASQVVPAGARDPALIFLVTTLAIALSFVPRVRLMPATYPTGEYLLLVFCTSVGSLARPQMLADIEPMLLAYMAVAMLGAIALHAAACALLRIDRDTCIITSTAAIYGPPFVPAVAMRLGNRAMVISGITAGIAGLALGNYLGLAIAALMRWLGA